MICPPDDSSSAGFLYVPSGAGSERRGVTVVAAHGRAAGIAPSRPRDRAATREALRRAEAVPSAELPLRGGGDALHGPYLCRRWLENGQRRRQYAKAADASPARARSAAWRRLHPPARSTRELLAELRHLLRTPEA